jgi:hypothetical protein
MGSLRMNRTRLSRVRSRAPGRTGRLQCILGRPFGARSTCDVCRAARTTSTNINFSLSPKLRDRIAPLYSRKLECSSFNSIGTLPARSHLAFLQAEAVEILFNISLQGTPNIREGLVRKDVFRAAGEAAPNGSVSGLSAGRLEFQTPGPMRATSVPRFQQASGQAPHRDREQERALKRISSAVRLQSLSSGSAHNWARPNRRLRRQHLEMRTPACANPPVRGRQRHADAL